MVKIFLFIIILIIFVFNILNIDYDNLLHVKNKTYVVNCLVCILVFIYMLIYNGE